MANPYMMVTLAVGQSREVTQKQEATEVTSVNLGEMRKPQTKVEVGRIAICGVSWTCQWRIFSQLGLQRRRKKRIGSEIQTIYRSFLDCNDVFTGAYLCQPHQILYIKYLQFFMYRLHIGKFINRTKRTMSDSLVFSLINQIEVVLHTKRGK